MFHFGIVKVRLFFMFRGGGGVIISNNELGDLTKLFLNLASFKSVENVFFHSFYHLSRGYHN